MKKGNGIALLPIGVFLVLYLGLGILFEYVLKIPMGFYNVPIVVAFLAAILVACVQNRKVNFDKNSGAVFGCSAVCSGLFRVSGDGNFRGNDHSADTNRGGSIYSFRVQSAVLCWIGHGRCDVW